MSSGLSIDLSPDLLETIAARAAELLAEREPAQEVDAWLTVAEAAEHLRCSSSRVYSLVSTRRIPFEKDGSRVLLRQSELDHWVEQGGARCP